MNMGGHMRSAAIVLLVLAAPIAAHCWGSNNYGQIGAGDFDGEFDEPTRNALGLDFGWELGS
jgi:hypothetical protein